jgi:hypothetical protein
MNGRQFEFDLGPPALAHRPSDVKQKWTSLELLARLSNAMEFLLPRAAAWAGSWRGCADLPRNFMSGFEGPCGLIVNMNRLTLAEPVWPVG